MIDAFQQALMVTGFVFVMMLVIDYVNVLFRGGWQERLVQHRWGQYLLAGMLGVIPGCLGAFTVVALYAHGALTMGAVVTAMIAASGDEAFVLLALVPGKAFVLMGLLCAIGVAAGALTDAFFGRYTAGWSCDDRQFKLHEETDCSCLSWKEVLHQWKNCTAIRGLLAGGLSVSLVMIAAGKMGPGEWNWLRVTLMAVSGLALFIVSTVPDHFLEEHLWRHIVRQHVPRVFLWTFGVLLALHMLSPHIDLKGMSQAGKWALLPVACLVGVIPESGPHLVFTMLYAQGALPFSILLANSVVQDGHGMLPMLAHSRRAFLVIKAINFSVGLLVGAVALLAGW